MDTNVENADYLDFHLAGRQASGWIAVGFSSSPNMVGDKHTTQHGPLLAGIGTKTFTFAFLHLYYLQVPKLITHNFASVLGSLCVQLNFFFLVAISLL